jgi:hypothetical protein
MTVPAGVRPVASTFRAAGNSPSASCPTANGGAEVRGDDHRGEDGTVKAVPFRCEARHCSPRFLAGT